MPDTSTSPTLAPAVAPERDWADELADTLLDQLTWMRDRRHWLAINLRVVKQEGRCEGVDKASQAVQQAFDARRGAA